MRALMRKLKTLKVIENRYELPQLCLRFFYGFITVVDAAILS